MTFGLVSLLVMGSVASPSYAAGPDPDSVFVNSISYEGSGCPAGTVGMSFAEDRTSFTLIFDQFLASIGPGVPKAESQKRCELDLALTAPDGWSWSIMQTDVRGYVQLPNGMQAESQVQYSSHEGRHANEGRLNTDENFRGPVSKDYLLRATTPKTAINWSRCGGTNHLYVAAEVGLKSRADSAGQAQISIDSLDSKVDSGDQNSPQGIRLVWQCCN